MDPALLTRCGGPRHISTEGAGSRVAPWWVLPSGAEDSHGHCALQRATLGKTLVLPEPSAPPEGWTRASPYTWVLGDCSDVPGGQPAPGVAGNDGGEDLSCLQLPALGSLGELGQAFAV